MTAPVVTFGAGVQMADEHEPEPRKRGVYPTLEGRLGKDGLEELRRLVDEALIDMNIQTARRVIERLERVPGGGRRNV